MKQPKAEPAVVATWTQRFVISDSFFSLLFFFLVVLRVVQSKNPAFPVGSHVVGRGGWRSHSLSDGSDLVPIMADWPQGVSMSLALGTIGMPG